MKLLRVLYRPSIDCLTSVACIRRSFSLSLRSVDSSFNMQNSADMTSITASDDTCARFRKPVFPVPVVPVRIDDSCPTDGATELMKIIRPEWPTDRIRFTVGLL